MSRIPFGITRNMELNIEDNLPMPTARVLGAKITQTKVSTLSHFKLNEMPNTTRSRYKKLSYEMPIWDRFGSIVLDDKNEDKKEFTSKFNQLSNNKQKLIYSKTA